MAHTTIEQFATDLKMPATALLEQLAAAGLAGKREGDKLSEQDKTRLLDYLRKQHGAAADAKKRITLTRKQTSEIKAAGSTGKARTIQVEVRKKRVLVRRDEGEAPQAPAPVVEEVPQAPVATPMLSAGEVAAREAEERKAQELIARQQEDLQKKQEEAAKRKSRKEKEAEEATARALAEAKAAEYANTAVGARSRREDAGAGGPGRRHRGHAAPPCSEAGREAREGRQEGAGPGVPGGGGAPPRPAPAR